MSEKTLPHPMVRKLVRMKKFAQKGEDRTLVLDYGDEDEMKKLGKTAWQRHIFVNITLLSVYPIADSQKSMDLTGSGSGFSDFYLNFFFFFSKIAQICSIKKMLTPYGRCRLT